MGLGSRLVPWAIKLLKVVVRITTCLIKKKGHFYPTILKNPNPKINKCISVQFKRGPEAFKTRAQWDSHRKGVDN